MDVRLDTVFCDQIEAVSDASIDFVIGDVKVRISQEVDEEGLMFFQSQIKTQNFHLKTIVMQELQELFHRDQYAECQNLEKLYEIFSDPGNAFGYGNEKPFTRQQFEQMIFRDSDRCSQTTFTGYYIFDQDTQVVGRAVLGQSFHPFDPKLFGHYAPSMNESEIGILIDEAMFTRENYKEILKALLCAAEIFKEQHIYKQDCNNQLKPVDRVVLTLIDPDSIDKDIEPDIYYFTSEKFEAAISVGLSKMGHYKSESRSRIILGKDLK